MAAFDLTVSLGDIVALGVAVAGGLGCVFTVRSNVRELATVVKITDESNDQRFTRVEAQQEDHKFEMKKVNDILVKLAETTGRQNMSDQRILQEGQRVDDLNKRIDAIASTLRELIMDRRTAREHREIGA